MNIEQLEDRLMPSIGPVTPFHYTPADNFTNGGSYAPAGAGFNLVAVYSPQQLNMVPDKAIVDMGPQVNGVDANFIKSITPYLHNPKVFAFYLVDEPNPVNVSAANIKAESDWIHTNDPGAKTFIDLGAGPLFTAYTPQNTDVDFVGIDPYPIRSWGVHFEYIPMAFIGAELLGWNANQIVPIYQAFGAFGSFVVPNQLEEEVSIAIWGLIDPTPPFDYAYSWGEWGASSLVDHPELQSVFLDHNMNATNPVYMLTSLALEYNKIEHNMGV